MVWANLTNADLLYVPRNVRRITLWLRRSSRSSSRSTFSGAGAAQLSFFTEGNAGGIAQRARGVGCGEDPGIAQWFDDRITGNAAEQNKLIWGPHGSQFTAFKAAPIRTSSTSGSRELSPSPSLPPTRSYAR